MAANLIPDNPSAAGDPGDWNPESLRRRLAPVPGLDLDSAARRIADELVAFNAVPVDRRSIVVADLLRAHVDGLMPRLLARVEGAAPPLARPVRQHVHAVEKLLKELGIAYARVVQFAAHHWIPFGQRKARHGPLVRAMDLLARRLHLAYRLYARPSRGVWASLHELHRIASDWELADAPLSSREPSADIIYRKALLLALVDPARLAAGDMPRVRDYVARFGDSASLASARPRADDVALFVIDSHQDRPPTPVARHRAVPGQNGVRYLDTQPLIERLKEHAAQLEAGVPPGRLGLPPDPDPVRYRALLRRLEAAWDGRPRKRAARLQFRPRATLQVGFPAVWAMLDPDAPTPTPAPAEWAILNESPAGIALRHMSGTVPPLRVGDVVGVRPKERDEIAVCLVRWIQSDSVDAIDLGLQQIAPRMAPVTYRPAGARGAAIVPVLFAPTSPQFERAPIVAAPAKLITAGLDFKISYLGADIRLHAERVLEGTPHTELIRVSPR
jgi:hypothetical protein